MSPKCETCPEKPENLFEITHEGKTKIVCFACKAELVGHTKTSKSTHVKKRPPKRDGDIEW